MAALLWILAQSAQAASNTWATGTGDWVEPANWTGGLDVPGATSGTTNADVATFGTLGTDGTVTVDAYRNIGGITYGTRDYTLSSGLLSLSGGATAITGSSGSLTVNSNIQLEAASTFTGTTAGAGILINGTVKGTAGVASNYALTLAGNRPTNEIAGAISDGTGGGTLSLSQTGGGTWELSTGNTYSGGTTILASGVTRLLVTHANALGTGTVAVNSAAGVGTYGQLQLKGGIALAPGTSNKITVQSGAAHTVTATSGLIVNVSESNSYAGDVESQGHLYLASRAGKLTLSGAVYSTYSSGVAGTTRVLSLSGAGDGEISGRISNTNGSRGWFGITKDGAGTWTLSNPGTLANRNGRLGNTTINAGALLINTDNSLTTDALVTTSVNSGGTLGGNGIIGGGSTVVASGGTLAAGATASTAGLLTFNSNLNHQTDSTFRWELFGNTESGRGTNFDGVDFTGSRSLTIATGVNASLVFNSATSTVDWADTSFWGSDREWLLFSGATAATLDSGSIFNSPSVTVDSLDQDFSLTGGAFSFEQVGQDVYLKYTAIPEPSALALLGLGLTALLVRRRS